MQMLQGRFEPGFKVNLQIKDLDIVSAFARSKGIAMPVMSQVLQLFIALDASGGGELDHSSIVQAIRGLRSLPLV